MKKEILFFLLLVLFIPDLVYSGSYSHQFIEEKIKRNELPKVCAYMGVGRKEHTSQGKRYREKFGPDWIHMHHYCWALADLQQGKPGQAIDNLNYVLRNSKRTFKLRPMVLKQKADILMMNQEYTSAVSVYTELIEIRPDSDLGYVGLANIFLLLGDKPRARKIAQQGLTLIPNSKQLQSFLK